MFPADSIKSENKVQSSEDNLTKEQTSDSTTATAVEQLGKNPDESSNTEESPSVDDNTLDKKPVAEEEKKEEA